MPDLGPQPDPAIEPGEPNPGGVDAIPPENGRPTVPDLSPDENPAVEEAPDPLKESMKEGEDTSTEATESDDGENDEPEKESPA